MMRNAFLIAILAVVSLVFQTSVAPLVGLGSILSLPVILIAYATISDRHGRGLWLAVATGFLLDLYSPLPFGTHLVALTSTALVAELLFVNAFTNRSIYAMIVLTLSATALYSLLWIGSSWLLGFAGFLSFTPSITLHAAWQFIGNVAGAIVLFYALLLFSSFFKGRFLTRSVTNL